MSHHPTEPQRASPARGPPLPRSGPGALAAGGVLPLEGASAVLNPAGGMVMAPILMPAAGEDWVVWRLCGLFVKHVKVLNPQRHQS